MNLVTRVMRASILILGLGFFLLPIYSASIFAFQERDGGFTIEPLRKATADEQLVDSLFLTFQLAFGTSVLTLLLLVPTVTYLHVIAPQARSWVGFLTLMPLVIPPIVQGVGFLYSMPMWLKSTPNALIFAYTILALPFSYRAIDAAYSSVDIKTLFDASSTLGANFKTLVFKVLIPNVKTGIFGAVFLTIALVLGEFAYASLLLWDTFPTVLAVSGMSGATTAVALSVMSLLGVWLILNIINSFSKSNYQTKRVGVK